MDEKGADRTEPAARSGSDGRGLAKGALFAGLEIDAEVGRGGMAVVYRAHDRALDQVRALKVLAGERSGDSAFQERFRRESRLAASIEHPNVVPIYRAGEEDGRLYIVMRLIAGPSLQELLAERGRLEPSHVAGLTPQIAAALDAAHAHGLIHRDVKPANVLLEGPAGEERAFLCDFGITKLAEAATELTATGAFVGTVDYVAPEQISGDPVDPRADVYSLACVAYHLLAGSPPFARQSRLATLFAHANAPRPEVADRRPGLPAEVDRVLARGMATNPADRYDSAGEFASDLVDALGGGSKLAGRPAPRTRDAVVTRGALEGEHKQVTILFADAVDSLTLAEQVDTEEWGAILKRFFAILRTAVERFGGRVDKFTGDGIMAVFGAPLAYEDHAARACHAAMTMLAELSGFSAELHRDTGLSFAVRIGLNSGEVVTGAIDAEDATEYTAVGQSVGLAERMQELAAPGKVCLSEHTANLVRGYFDLGDLGRLEVEGMQQPVHAYELLGLGSLRTPLEQSEAHGLSPFVARRDELATLESALAGAESGDGTIIGIQGEPGIGKSRLCYEFAAACAGRGVEVVEAHCRARGDSPPLLPLLEMVRAAFGVTEEDSAEVARQKVAGRVAELDQAVSEELPLIFDFLGVSDPEHPLPRMSAEARQRHLFDALDRILRARSERAVALYVIEDLHWIDRGSEVFLENLVRTIPGTRTLLVLTFRDYEAAWMKGGSYRRLSLPPLDARASTALLYELLGMDPSVEPAVERIRGRAGGNPFFIEEMVRGLAAAGSLSGKRGRYHVDRALDTDAIPASVEVVLEARIDRLPEREKALLEAAAVIGREFTEPVLRWVAGLAEPEFRVTLAGLVADEFVDRQTTRPEPRYAFRHQLSRDVAYQALLAERRRPLHRRVARAIESAYPERLDELASVIGHHLERAGEPLEAARWTARAAAWTAYTAPVESLQLWEKARELTDAAGEGDEAAAMGIGARIGILQIGWRLGLSDEAARRALDEGLRLAERTEDPASSAGLLASYASLRAILGEGPQHIEMMREAIRLHEPAGDPGFQVAMQAGLGWILFTSGRVAEAFEAVERGVELSGGDPTMGAGTSIENPYAWCLLQGAQWGVHVRRLTVREAFERLRRASEVSREQATPETFGWTNAVWVGVARVAGRTARSPVHAGRAVEIAERIGDSFSRGMAHGTLGRAYVDNEDFERAIPELEKALEIWRGARTALNVAAWFVSDLAEAHLGMGDAERALETATEAVRVATERGARFHEIDAQVALARARDAVGGPRAAEEAEAALARAEALVDELGVLGIEVFEERARRAGLAGDGSGRERALREAHRRLTEVGADAREKRIAERLALESAP